MLTLFARRGDYGLAFEDACVRLMTPPAFLRVLSREWHRPEETYAFGQPRPDAEGGAAYNA